MPPKRRNVDDSNDVSESKRRVTRSASKAAAPANEARAWKTKEVIAKASKPKKPAKKSAPPKAEKTTKKTDDPKKAKVFKKASKKTNDSRNDESPSETTPTDNSWKPPTTLTIEHDSLKNPIICHRYSGLKILAPTLIFTHGAGGTLSAPAVVNFCTGYTNEVLAFQGSMNLNARVKGFHACMSHLGVDERGFVLGGRSMGARAAVIAATEVLASERKFLGSHQELSLILISYPLKGPKGDIRDEILLGLPSRVRVLFIIGDNDVMCPLDLLEETRKKMVAKTRLLIVRGADHGMHVKHVAEEKRLVEKAGTQAALWADIQGEPFHQDWEIK